METGRRIGQSVGTVAVVGGVVTGFAGLVAGVFAFLNGEAVGAGACFAAAAIAFGLVANAVLRG